MTYRSRAAGKRNRWTRAKCVRRVVVPHSHELGYLQDVLDKRLAFESKPRRKGPTWRVEVKLEPGPYLVEMGLVVEPPAPWGVWVELDGENAEVRSLPEGARELLELGWKLPPWSVEELVAQKTMLRSLVLHNSWGRSRAPIQLRWLHQRRERIWRHSRFDVTFSNMTFVGVDLLWGEQCGHDVVLPDIDWMTSVGGIMPA